MGVTVTILGVGEDNNGGTLEGGRYRGVVGDGIQLSPVS